jgi:hypothetical protein
MNTLMVYPCYTAVKKNSRPVGHLGRIGWQTTLGVGHVESLRYTDLRFTVQRGLCSKMRSRLCFQMFLCVTDLNLDAFWVL